MTPPGAVEPVDCGLPDTWACSATLREFRVVVVAGPESCLVSKSMERVPLGMM